MFINSININSISNISFLCEAMAAKRKSATPLEILELLYSKKQIKLFIEPQILLFISRITGVGCKMLIQEMCELEFLTSPGQRDRFPSYFLHFLFSYFFKKDLPQDEFCTPHATFYWA